MEASPAIRHTPLITNPNTADMIAAACGTKPYSELGLEN